MSAAMPRAWRAMWTRRCCASWRTMGMDHARARDWLTAMAKDKRYLRDVY
jgi:hypothetical protein